MQARRARGRMRIRGGILRLSETLQNNRVSQYMGGTHVRCRRVAIERQSCVSKYFHTLEIPTGSVLTSSRRRLSVSSHQRTNHKIRHFRVNLRIRALFSSIKPFDQTLSQLRSHGYSYLESYTATANTKNINPWFPKCQMHSCNFAYLV